VSLPALLLLQLIAPPVPATALTKFGVVGDNQLNAFNTFNAICTQLATERIDCFIGLGDHVQNHGLPGEWQHLWLIPLTPIAQVLRLGCIGNHDDVLGYTANVWPSQQHPLTSPYGNAIAVYSAVTVGSVRFVFLDTNEVPAIRLSLAQGGAQAAWLIAETASGDWQSARWRVVCWHHPCLTELWDGGCNAPCLSERRWLMDHLAASRASLCLNGHAHAYQRGSYRGLPFIISGGGGGWLDTTRCWDHPEITVAQAVWHYLTIEAGETLTVTAKTPTGQQIDQVVIQ
jgi:hypothetical protein